MHALLLVLALAASAQDAPTKEQRLFKAIESADAAQVRAVLAEPGPLDLEARNESGDTPLIRAASRMPEDAKPGAVAAIVDALLDKGARLDAVGAKMEVYQSWTVGSTPLFASVFWRNTAAYERLVQRGASRRAPNGKTLFMVACAQGELELADQLLKTGDQLDAVDDEGQTALMAVVDSLADRARPLLYLLSKNPNLELADAKGRTALLRAACGSKLDAVQLLLSRGANINAQDRDGNTALMCAVAGHSFFEIGHVLLETLLDKGADPSAVNADGKTALDLAKEAENKEAIFILKNYGLGGQIKDKIDRTQARLAPTLRELSAFGAAH